MGELHQLLTAACFAASCGLRGFLPLFLLSSAVRLGHIEPKVINPDIYPYIAGNDTVYYIILLLTVIELCGDKLPSFSSFLDAMLLIVRPLSGVIAALVFLNLHDTVLNYILAFGMGALLSLPIHSYQSSCHLFSEVGFTSYYNMFLSFTSDVMALGGAVLGLIIPQAALPLLLLLIFFTMSLFKKWRLVIISGEDDIIEIDKSKDAADILEIQRLKSKKHKRKK